MWYEVDDARIMDVQPGWVAYQPASGRLLEVTEVRDGQVWAGDEVVFPTELLTGWQFFSEAPRDEWMLETLSTLEAKAGEPWEPVRVTPWWSDVPLLGRQPVTAKDERPSFMEDHWPLVGLDDSAHATYIQASAAEFGPDQVEAHSKLDPIVLVPTSTGWERVHITIDLWVYRES